MIDGEIMQVGTGKSGYRGPDAEAQGLQDYTDLCGKSGDRIEITYSFGKEYKMVRLRISILPDTEIVSISDIYAPAFLYENEIHNLFGINIKMISLDYHGNLYRIKKEAPFKE